jgi:glycosyltransferase involved in cell wall biosynthesis
MIAPVVGNHSSFVGGRSSVVGSWYYRRQVDAHAGSRFVYMKITMLLTVGLERPSGLRFGGLARGLARRGHDVTVLALHPDWAHAQPRSWREGRLHVRYVGQMHAQKTGGAPRRFGPLQLLSVVLRSTAALAAAAVGTPSDCLHICKPQPINGMAALLANSVRRHPLYLDCDDYEAGSNRFTAAWQRRVFSWWEDHLPPLMEGITVNTAFLGERAVVLGVDPARIVRVPNGVDLAHFTPVAPQHVAALRDALGLVGRRVVAFAGTFSLQNHPVDLLIDALPALVRHEPRTTLLMVGDGEDRVLLQRRCAEAGFAHHVVWTGHVGRSMLRALLGMADLSVDPVHDDDVARARSPLKIFESLALSVPVVTADVGDRRALLGDGTAGLVVRAGDAGALADGIGRLLNDRADLEAKAAAARTHVRAYDWNELAREFERVYG